MPPAARGGFLKKLPRAASGPVKHLQKLLINVQIFTSPLSCLSCLLLCNVSHLLV
jgi:hypothetical protein